MRRIQVRYYLYEHVAASDLATKDIFAKVFPGVMGLSDSLLSCTAQELLARCPRL